MICIFCNNICNPHTCTRCEVNYFINFSGDYNDHYFGCMFNINKMQFSLHMNTLTVRRFCPDEKIFPFRYLFNLDKLKNLILFM